MAVPLLVELSDWVGRSYIAVDNLLEPGPQVGNEVIEIGHGRIIDRQSQEGCPVVGDQRQIDGRADRGDQGPGANHPGTGDIYGERRPGDIACGDVRGLHR